MFKLTKEEIEAFEALEEYEQNNIEKLKKRRMSSIAIVAALILLLLLGIALTFELEIETDSYKILMPIVGVLSFVFLYLIATMPLARSKPEPLDKEFEKINKEIIDEYALKAIKIPDEFSDISIKMLIINICIWALFFVLGSEKVSLTIKFIVFVLEGILMFISFKLGGKRKPIKAELKEKNRTLANELLLKKIDPNIEYLYSAKSKENIYNEYMNVGYQTGEIEEFIAKDEFCGSILDNVFVRGTCIDVNKQKGKDNYDLFSGMFIKAKINKNINANILMFSSYVNRFKLPYGCEKIELDSPEFEEYFDIFTDNKVVALRILTSNVMEELVNICESFFGTLDILICNDILYLRIPTYSFFLDETYDGIIDGEKIKSSYKQIKKTLGIIKEIKKLTDEL